MIKGLEKVDSIVIVGGGSAGWMTAAYLSKVLVGVNVVLVESPTLPVIGVGEATIPFIRDYMKKIGFHDDKSWMRECDATFKTGILYENWLNKGDFYWHPFEYLDYLDIHTHTGHCWLHLHHNGHPRFQNKRSFYNSFFCTTTLNAECNKAPSVSEYAYNFDSHLFVQLLKIRSPEVKHIIDDVLVVNLNEHGGIDSLQTKYSGELKADLYIDCTGFKRLLISEVAPDLKFISYSKSLFCNRAVVLHFPYENEEQKKVLMHPFVKASAQSAGWIWTIPLYSKISGGYVYASNYISDHDAELELRRFFGKELTEDLNSFKLKFESGKLKHLWHKNCVAIGLSGGFIEPLESTGLAIIQMSVEMLASMLDAHYYDKQIINRYNGYLEKFYTDIVQFITSHYFLTNREDTEFWKAVKYETLITGDLEARLKIFQNYLPTTSTKGVSEVWMFRDFSWFSVLLGMNFNFDKQNIDISKIDTMKNILATKQKTIESLINKLPIHYHYLKDQIYK